jgi:hypothetical protein
MSQYFMHFIDDHGEATDEEGFTAEDEDAARLVGMKAAGHIIAEEMGNGRQTIAFMLCLDDENGNRLGAFPVAASCASFASPRFSRAVPANEAQSAAD